MYTAHYPEELQTLIHDFDRHYEHDLDQLSKNIETIDAYASQHNDPSLSGFVCFQKARLSLLQRRDSVAYRQHLLRAMDLLRRPDDADILACCYNLIGVESMGNCNYDLALSHYLTAIKILDSLRDDALSAMVHSNIGTLYAAIHDYTSALTYTQECIRLIERDLSDASKLEIYLVGVCLSGWLALETGNAEATRSAYDKLWQLRMSTAVSEQIMQRVIISLFEGRHAYEAGEFADAYRIFDEVIARLSGPDPASVAADDLCRFGSFLLWAEDYDRLKPILSYLEGILGSTIPMNEQIAIAELHIRYAQAISDDALLKQWQHTYYDLNHTLTMSKSDIYTFSLALTEFKDPVGKTRLMELEEDVRTRRQKDIDSVTLLPSRRQFNQDLLDAYRIAVRDDTALGIAAIEIDGFEDIINHNTRAMVETVLKHVADRMRDSAADTSSCYRYGAGRFLMIYRGMSNHEIYARATLLQESVAATLLADEPGGTDVRVTVSQGISNRLPTPSVHLWDFISEANRALTALRRQKASNEIAFNAKKH